MNNVEKLGEIILYHGSLEELNSRSLERKYKFADHDSFLSQLYSGANLEWIGDHLENKRDDKIDPRDLRLKRYIMLCRSRISDFDPSYDHIFRCIGKRGSIYGIENFLFDLSKEENLSEEEVNERFSVFKAMPYKSREDVEAVRKSCLSDKSDESLDPNKIRSMNEGLYELLSIPSLRGNSYSRLAGLLESTTRVIGSDRIGFLLDVFPVLNNLVNSDKEIAEASYNDAEEVFLMGMPKGKLLLRPYLEEVQFVSESIGDRKSRDFYLDTLHELFKDYYGRSSDGKTEETEVKDKYRACFSSLEGMDQHSRIRAYEFVHSVAHDIRRNLRLGDRQSSLYLDEAIGIIASSLSKDQEKGANFIGSVLNYKEK